MKEEEARQVILSPVVTEKCTVLQDKHNQYTFRVDPRANRIKIKQAVEKLFSVTVEGVSVILVRGKERKVGKSAGFRPGWKKAMVTVKKGEKIALS